MQRKLVTTNTPYLFIILMLYGIYAAPKLKSGYQLSIIASGLNPTTMAVAPDGRVFICEKHGSLRVVQNDELLEEPALTLTVDNYNERGLIGIALDPNWSKNNYVYLHYTPKTTPPRVSRFTIYNDVADMGSETVLFEMDPLEVAGVHNGGALAFDSQGYLYIATGNIGVNSHSQNLQSTWGKILRLRADGSIPNDNPFYNSLQGKYKAIWAYGLRNPFTMSVDPSTDKLYINEVGEASWEEINVAQKGANYGWPMFEGLADTPDSTIAQPIFTYFHQNRSCSITGGTFYYSPASRKRAEILPFPDEFKGKYFFGDYCAGWIRAVDLNRKYEPVTTMSDNQAFITGLEAALGVATGPDGSLYVLDRGNSNGSINVNTEVDTGVLYKVIRTTDLGPSVFLQPKSKLVSVDYSASFTVGANGDGLTYQWYRNNEPIPDSNTNTITITNVQLTQNATQIYVRIFNSHGDTTSDTAYLYVTTRKPPLLEITSPTASDTYSAGDTFFFEGSATSTEDSNVQLSWTVILHHQEHTHPFLGPITDVTEGNFTIPVIGEVDHVQWYRVDLFAIDSLGLSAEIFVDIHPKLGTIRILSDTNGVTLELDGTTITPPTDLVGVVGMTRTLSAPPIQVLDHADLSFDYWSSGIGNRSIQLTFAPEDYSITAYYSAELLNAATGVNVDLVLLVWTLLALFSL